MKNYLKKLIFEGQIPHLMMLRKVVLVIALIAPFLIIPLNHEFLKFGVYGWYALIFVMLIRPLSDIFPKIGLFRSLTLFRKEMGILAGLLILAHVIGFFMVRDVPILKSFIDPEYWDLSRHFGWGMLGIACLVPLLLTSNKKAMLWLKSAWKWVQKLAYPFFFFGGIHIYLTGQEKALISMSLVAVAWVLAQYFKAQRNNKSNQSSQKGGVN